MARCRTGMHEAVVADIERQLANAGRIGDMFDGMGGVEPLVEDSFGAGCRHSLRGGLSAEPVQQRGCL